MEGFLGIQIEKGSKVPLYQQLADALCLLIEDGILPPNSKLPPIRTMAAKLHVNNVTVVTAYKYLENKKVVYSHMGSGTFVSPIPVNQIPEPVIVDNVASFEDRLYLEHAINFVSTSMPHKLFPVDQFKEAFNKVLEREKGGAFRYQQSMGYEPLRQILCEYLKSYKILTNMDQVQILSGAQQGIDIISKALIRYGDVVFVEKPTFYGAAGAFLSHGGKIVEIDMQEDGVDMDMLENLMKMYRPRFIYVMAYFQTPTGISYSLDKKRKLLDLAEQYDAYLVEDDNLYDFNYGDAPILSLKALDYKNRVIYIKSFSKILMPGLRIGFMVIPKKILHHVMTAKYTTDISTSGFIQKALDYYLREYGWQEHTKAMCSYGGQKYKKALRCADKYLKGKVTYYRPEGGISLWIDLPAFLKADILCSRLLEKNVILSPGNQFYMGGEESHHVRLCFTNVTDDAIQVGIKRIGECIDELEQYEKKLTGN